MDFDLEQELQEKTEEQQEILSNLDTLFADTDFTKTENDNYISWDLENDDIIASFSIDNDTFKFSCYVTKQGDTNSSTYSAKGNMGDIEKNAEKFLIEVDDFINFQSSRAIFK